ncbi:MAG: Na+/H+ antiporter NhaA [Pseudohongiellaceae bacterium]
MQESESNILAFFRLESAGGILLMGSAVLAMVLANSPLDGLYQSFLATPVETRFGALEIAKPLLLWINDGLMAVFFFLVGLELKRELVEGELSEPSNIILPGVGAIGGMAFPAAIYLLFNYDDPVASQGWAIPAATDIAFALGVLTLLGSSVPTSIKVFLTSLAIFDDVAAIVIIAVFYTASISMVGLAVVAACLPVLFLLNRYNIIEKSPYMFVGIIMWVAMLKSGVHATLAGVIVAMFIPMRCRKDPSFSPLASLEHDLHSVVAYFVLPVFAFANAGISFRGLDSNQLLHSAPVGIAIGLVIGKQLGIFSLCFIAVKSGLTSLPKGITFPRLYGTAALCGIGFTMSLFIGGLAFSDSATVFDERIGIIAGSLLSGIIGYFVLRRSLRS